MSNVEAGRFPEDLELLPYKVELEVFTGPLDLLLYLVEKDEIDIFDIPISRITRQYLEYLSVLETIDIELAGEFLVMAARLMEIKSRMLLPRPQTADEEPDDPRRELVRQLLEYRKYRQATAQLQELARRESLVYRRVPDTSSVLTEQKPGPGLVPVQGVQVWDLVAAFARVLRDAQVTAASSRVRYDETPIHVHMERIMEELRKRGQLAFSELFQGQYDRGRLVGIFLALLELVKTRRVRAEQNELFGEIWIFPVEQPADTTAAAS